MSNQVALVTGGASGIGKAVAQNLISRGITVVISGRRQEAGDAAVAEISALAKNGAQVRFVRNDVANEDSVKAMVDGIISEFGRLDLAVNNAGVSNESLALDQSSSQNYREWAIYLTQVTPRSCVCWWPEPAKLCPETAPAAALGGVGRVRTPAMAFCGCHAVGRRVMAPVQATSAHSSAGDR